MARNWDREEEFAHGSTSSIVGRTGYFADSSEAAFWRGRSIGYQDRVKQEKPGGWQPFAVFAIGLLVGASLGIAATTIPF
jgi:hypothetical protein